MNLKGRNWRYYELGQRTSASQPTRFTLQLKVYQNAKTDTKHDPVKGECGYVYLSCQGNRIAINARKEC